MIHPLFCHAFGSFFAPLHRGYRCLCVCRKDTKELKSYVKGKGLGTPATRADIIEGLISAKYIERKKKLLYLTEFGKKYINALPENIKSAELTAHWEQMLSDIEQGKCKEEDLMNEIIKNVNGVIENDEVTVESAAEDTEETAAEQPAEIGKCPWCGSPIREGPKAFYCSNGEDCDFFIYKHDKRIGRSYTANEISELLANGKVTLRGCTSSKGNKYAAVSSERLADRAQAVYHQTRFYFQGTLLHFRTRERCFAWAWQRLF